jgi:hypothetical protein
VKSAGFREIAAVAAGFAVLACIATWPLALHPGRVAYEIGVNFDAQFSVWNVAWVARALVADPAHLFDANIFYPHRWTLAYSEANLGAGALAAPVYWATRNVYAAHNIVLLLTFILSGTSMYLLARHLGGSRGAAAGPAIAFAFCPHVFAHLPHIQLLMTWGLPLSLLALHRLVERPSLPRGAALGLIMAVEAYCCAYYAVFGMLLIGYGAIFFAVARRLWRDRRFLIAVCLAAAVAATLTAPLAAVYLMIQRTTGFARSVDAAGSFSANWSAYLASSAYAHGWILSLIPRWHEVLFPGFVALGFGLAGLWAGLFARGRDRELAIFYGSVAALALWESFGPAAGLYRLTYAAVPGFSFLRAPSRFGLLVTLSLAALASFAIGRLRANRPRSAWVAGAIAAAAFAELLVPLRLMPVPPPDASHAALASLPAGAVLELPVYSEQFAYIRTRYMLASTEDWHPLVDAYSDYIPQDFRDRAETLASFPDRASIDELRREGVRYAIVHVSEYSGAMRETFDAGERAFAAELTLLHGDDSSRLYEISGVR